MLYPSKWTPVVLEHFNKFVSPSIQYHSGKWVIEEYPEMFDPYSGITNNLSESMNAVLKRENDWKELPVDLLALGFYYIQNFENYEILRGRSGMGNYHLKAELKRAFIPPSDLTLPKRVVCPDEVIEYLKNEKPFHQVEKLIPDTPSDNKQEIVEKTPVNTEIASVNIKDDKTVIKKERDDTVNQAPVINFPVFNTDSSQQSLARFIVENNLITSL